MQPKDGFNTALNCTIIFKLGICLSQITYLYKKILKLFQPVLSMGNNSLEIMEDGKYKDLKVYWKK